jgi:NTE family protein
MTTLRFPCHGWERDVVRYRCALPADEQARLRAAKPGWRCDDVSFTLTRISFDDLDPGDAARLHAVPTCLRLPAAAVDEFAHGGAEALRRNAAVAAFRASHRD